MLSISPSLLIRRSHSPLFSSSSLRSVFFFFNHSAPTEIYTLSLHDALPIWLCACLTSPGTRLPPSWRAGRQAWRRCSARSEEHTSELQSHSDLVCRLLLEKKNKGTKKLLKHAGKKNLSFEAITTTYLKSAER